MTSTPPDSIRYAWRRAVNRDPRLSDTTRRVMFEFEGYAEPDGTRIHPGDEKIAEALQKADGSHVSISSVVRARNTATELGYMLLVKKGGRRKVNGVVVKRASEYRLTLHLAEVNTSHVTQTTSDVTSGAVSAGQITCHQAQDHMSPRRHTTSPFPTSPDEEIKNARTAEPTRGEMSTAQARAWLDGEPTKDPHPLHPEWAPNRRHRDEAAELGLDVEAEAEVFRQGMTEVGERRRRWGAAFTEYLREQAAGVAGATFDVVDQDAMAAHAAEAGVEALRAKLSAEAQAKAEWFDQLDALMRALPDPMQRVDQLSGRHIAALDKLRLAGITPEGILDALRAKQAAAAAAETPEVVEDQGDDVEAPSPSVAEVAVDDAEWQVAAENRRVVTALRKIDRRLITRKLRGTELAEAEAMLRGGMHHEQVYAALVEAHKAKRAELDSTRAVA
ncbi:hypothetical protein [Rhodococcus koreensis]|uniref:hypothetical protein n=1 Tax=Rhodococcus koreensis TaxID=99653 RepID=UPI00367296C6